MFVNVGIRNVSVLYDRNDFAAHDLLARTAREAGRKGRRGNRKELRITR